MPGFLLEHREPLITDRHSFSIGSPNLGHGKRSDGLGRRRRDPDAAVGLFVPISNSLIRLSESAFELV